MMVSVLSAISLGLMIIHGLMWESGVDFDAVLIASAVCFGVAWILVFLSRREAQEFASGGRSESPILVTPRRETHDPADFLFSRRESLSHLIGFALDETHVRTRVYVLAFVIPAFIAYDRILFHPAYQSNPWPFLLLFFAVPAVLIFLPYWHVRSIRSREDVKRERVARLEREPATSSALRPAVGLRDETEMALDTVEVYWDEKEAFADCPQCQLKYKVTKIIGNPKYDRDRQLPGIQVRCRVCEAIFTLPAKRQ